VAEWSVDCSSGNCDADGWRYAFNWPRDISFAKNYYDAPDKPVRNFVRRRRWLRVRRLDAMAGSAEPQPEPEPEPDV
jgi:hypothetical protein